MTASTTVTMDGFVYEHDAFGLVISCEKEPEPPEVPPECWHRAEPWDAERAHAATLAACRGQR